MPISDKNSVRVFISKSSYTCEWTMKSMCRRNYRIQGHSFPYHWITKAVIVICLVQQKILTNLHMLALSGPEFCSCSCIFTSSVLQLILSLIFQLAKAKERVSDLTVEAENTAVSYSWCIVKVHVRSCVSHKGLHQWWDDTHSKALNKYLLYVNGLNRPICFHCIQS